MRRELLIEYVLYNDERERHVLSVHNVYADSGEWLHYEIKESCFDDNEIELMETTSDNMMVNKLCGWHENNVGYLKP